jgi:hypothetical protein
MDLFGQFRDQVIARFAANSYLSTGTAATLYASDSDSETEEDVLRKINTRLNLVGVVGTLHGPRIEKTEGDRVTCRGGIWWEVNKTKNQSTDGTGKPGRLIWQESIAILRRWSPDLQDDDGNLCRPFSQILINAAERVGEDEGVELWMIDFETNLAL